MSGRADVPRLPLGLASVDRLTVEHIARVSTGHPTPRSTAATSASRLGSVRNSPRSVSGYPHAASMPAVHGSDSRARSVAGDLASLESRAMDYDQSSAKILKQLYEEREEKRRLLHLMRAAGSDLVEPWNKMELIDNSGVQAGSRARDLAEPALPPRTAPRHDRGRSAHAATTAKKISKDASNGAAPEGQSSAVQSNPSSSQFSFTLPTFEVSLPSFPSVDMSLPSLASVFHSAARKDATEEERLNVLLYQAGQEAVSNTDPASKYWLQKSPVSEINQPSGRRGLDFEEADPEQDALALPSDAAAIEGFEAAIQLERKRCQILSQQLLERDDQLHKLEREREFLVKKCASLSLGVETGGTEPAAPDEAAELKARLDSALAALDHHVQREATLVKEAQQAQEECAQAVEALECARKERDDAIARQVQQQKMLVERAGALQAAVQQEGETAQLRTLVQTLESELAEARRASESACADAHSMRQHADRLRKEQESSARQMEEVVTACKAAERMAADAQAEIDAIRSKGTEQRLSAVEEQYSKLANELEATATKLAAAMESETSLKGQLDEAKQKLLNSTKSADERVLAMQREHTDLQEKLKMERSKAEKQAWDLEEAQTALRAVHGAICKQAPAAVVGGIGVALGSETVSVKGKQRKVVKITQLATAGPAAKCGKVQVGDWLTELDGKDLTGFTLKQVKEMTKGPPGSPLKLQLRRDGTQFDVILERSGGTGTSNASISDSSSMTSGAAGVASLAGREPTISDLGKESCNAATALYEELDRLRRSLTTASEELSRRSQTHATGVGDASKRGMRRAELTVLSAKNLPNVDKTGACAAFCEFEWRGFKGKTSVKAHSCSPRWEETFAFFFDDVTSLADLLIVVKDWRADGQVCDEKRIGQVLIPAESLQTFLQQDQVAHEEGSFAVLDQHGKEIVGQDNEPCVIDLKMRVLGHGEAHASNVEVPHRTGTAAETEGSKWEVFDKLTADLSAAERQVAEHQLEKEKTARELTESLALLHALVAAVCRDERLLPDAASKVGGVGLALVQKAEGSGSKAVGDKALLDKRSFLKIGAIAAGGPADIDRGLGVGDRVLAVDDQDVSALDAKAVGLLLKGPVGTSVKIKALKDDTSDALPYEVSLRREELHSGGADFAEANTPRRLDFAAVEIGKRGCQVAASMHTELDQLRARLSSAESALAEAKEELNQKSMEAAAAASTADSSHKDSAALESATALAKKLSDALKSEKTAVSALEKDKLMLSQELTRAQVELQQLQQDLDVQRRDAAAAALAGAAAADEGAACIAELKLEAQAAEDKIKAVLLQKEEVDSELQDCRRKQADQALDLEEATMAVKAMHSIICKQGPAAAQGGIGVALGSEMVRVKGSPIKMYKVAQLASSGPAAGSGAIQAGDYILEVDGRKLAGMHSKDVKLLIRGPSGTSITLKAQRPGAGSGPYHVTLTRGGGEADQSLASMSETASSVGGSTMGASGRLVGREPSVGERMKEGSDAAARLHEELERLRAGGGASAQAANKYAREAADLANELSKARSRLAESEARADVLERKVQQSVAALEESAALLEKREHSDAETLNKVLADNQALQRALLLVDDQAAATGALALLHTGANTPGTADTPALATEGGGTSAASVDGKSTTGDDDARSTSASVYSAVSGKTPELCGVGMRVTNVAPHRVVSFLPNGPVGKSGAVEVGDLLVAVNGVETQAKEIKEVRRLMTGTQGSEVELRFVGLRDGNKETFAVTVIRQPPPKTTRSPIFHAVQLLALRLLPGMSP